jgi:hypothetical protein
VAKVTSELDNVITKRGDTGERAGKVALQQLSDCEEL